MFSCHTTRNGYLKGYLLCSLLWLTTFSTGFAEDTIGPSPQSQEVSVSGQGASGLPDGAVEYNKGVELFQIAQIQNEKGNSSGQKKLLKEAIHQFEAALKINPKLVEAQSNIGFAYLTLRDYRQSIRAFEKALGINPNHLNTLNGLSTAYAFDKKTDQAIETFNKLTRLDPGNSQYFFNKGSVLQKAGRLQEAEQTYLQALKIKPNDQRVLFNLGTLYENQGKLEQAKPYYEKAKGVEIGNSIGLEAIRRLENINAALKQP
ncbi:tetratricopeptide repeat protein [Vampirovibrio sp.]|uniref:tetratricopeptide repeat protein n=1 Tax=Vampirovibrio sp. TaxID=2717857 RepID=UPI003593E5DC